MLEVKVVREVTRPHYQVFTEIIRIPSIDKLTPKIARMAIGTAFGGRDNATVWDMAAGYGYRVYPNTARKVYLDDIQ